MVYIPSYTSPDIIKEFHERVTTLLKKEYHTLLAVARIDSPRIEVHGSEKLTSFGFNELRNFVEKTINGEYE